MKNKKHTCTYEEAFGGTYLFQDTGNNSDVKSDKVPDLKYSTGPGIGNEKFFVTLETDPFKRGDIFDKQIDIILDEVEASSTGRVEENNQKYREATMEDPIFGTIKFMYLVDEEAHNNLSDGKYDGKIINTESVHKGLRYNKGKLRYDLLHPKALEGMTKVLTKGAEKYLPRNWELGMRWSDVMQSLERHLQAFKDGEDFDPETGELHMDHIQCNAHFLSAYYHIYPQGDDRNLWFKRPIKRLYLDIDGVLADFEKHFLTYLNLPMDHPTDWNDYRFRDKFSEIENDLTFWSGIPRIFDPAEFDYPIKGYVTARPIDNQLTSAWLECAGFPKGELINVGSNGSKVEILKEKCDVFVDDSIYNFTELQSAGVTCFLMSRPHNKKYNVGFYRVQDIKDLLKRLKSL